MPLNLGGLHGLVSEAYWLVSEAYWMESEAYSE